jgi:elongation factor G
MEAYLEGEMPDNDEIRALIRKGTCAVSSSRSSAARPSRTRASSRCSTPLSTSCRARSTFRQSGHRSEDRSRDHAQGSSDDEPLSMLAFKIMNDPFVGSLTFCRIYSGKLETGTSLMNTVKEKRERIGRMLQMHSNSREDIKEAFAGDIVAIAGLKETTTGDTLCDPLKPVILERMEFPDPVISIAVEPKTKATRKRWASRSTAWLPKIRRSASSSDEESGQTIIGHGRIAPRHPRRPHEARVQGRGQYRRAAGCLPRDDHQGIADIDYTHKKQSGGSGQFARVKITLRAEPDGEDFVFESTVVGGSFRRNTSRASKRASSRSWTPVRSPASRCSASRQP